MNNYTEENLLGGYAPDASGKMTFHLSGLGAYLVLKNEEEQNSERKEVLIDGIYLIKEGVRTQLNQLLQDGWTCIDDKEYAWPKNVRFLFPIPIEKLDQLSEPYQSRHQQLRF
jgi:hypothetical protein